MISLKTQSPAYWQKDFAIDDHDLQFLHDMIVEAGAPVPMQTLALALIRERCRRELDARRSELDKGPIYQPKDAYQIGQTVIFPAFSFAAARVIDTRPGYDPARGAFQVIKVQFEESGEQREFASQLTTPHPLNRPDADDGLAFLNDLVSPEALYEQFGSEVSARLAERLNAPDSPFILYQGQWLARGMAAPINVGHLNIAEAAIDVAGAPLSAEQILRNLDLPAEIPFEVQQFSLNAALSADERFDDVGWDGQVLWFLRRMEPADALETPARLQGLDEPYDAKIIKPALAALEQELDDELSAGHNDIGAAAYTANVTLIYPHVRSGTLPLSPRVRALFPRGSYQHTRVELIDAQRGETIVGWINHQGRYIAGLSEWYRRSQMPAGAYLRLERTKKPGVVLINFEPRRLRREWVRVASVSAGALSFGLQKRPISCDYDELMAVDHADARQIDEFANQLLAERRPLSKIVREVVRCLVGLNPSGTVHAKTVYSAVNVVRRCPPGAIFAILSSDPAYVDEGEGLWAYHETGA